MKKGFMLLEVLVATAIGAILLSFQCCILIKSVNWYNKNITTLRDSSYCDEGLIIIKNFIYMNMVEVNTTNNEIDINTSDNMLKKIYLIRSSEKVVVDYYDDYGYGYGLIATNVVAQNISNMEAIKKGDLIYISLVDNEGKRISQCFGIKKVY